MEPNQKKRLGGYNKISILHGVFSRLEHIRGESLDHQRCKSSCSPSENQEFLDLALLIQSMNWKKQ